MRLYKSFALTATKFVHKMHRHTIRVEKNSRWPSAHKYVHLHRCAVGLLLNWCSSYRCAMLFTKRLPSSRTRSASASVTSVICSRTRSASASVTSVICGDMYWQMFDVCLRYDKLSQSTIVGNYLIYCLSNFNWMWHKMYIYLVK